MRTGRLVLVLTGSLALAALAAVWFVPPMLDWNRYREDIAALASRGIGRPVRIDGAVSLSLLPEPVLTASGMTVADSGDGVLLRADALRLRVALGTLLSGRVDARELVLRGADLHLPWPPEAGALAQRPPSWLSGLQARVEGSRLQVGGVVFTDIAGTLATDPDTGTLSANGSGRWGGQTWRVIARLSEPGHDGSAALDASVDGEDRLRDTGGTFSGQIGADGALSGRVTGRGSDLSLLLPAPPQPWTGEGRLTASAGLAVADELQVVLAGVPARGALALRVSPDARLDVALASNRLDLDAWWPVLLRGAGPMLPTGVDLSAEAASFAGGQLRRVRVALDLGPDGAVVRDASAELPGQASLVLAGSAGRNGGFHGTARLGAPDLRTTLRWLEPAVPGLAAMRPDAALQTGQLTADVSAESGLIGLSALRGVLDGAAISGTATFRPGTRPALTVDLQANRLALDPWLPDPEARDALPRLSRRFRAFDLALRVQARGATWRGLPVAATLDMAAENGRIAVRRLEATVRGVRLALSGTLSDGARLSDGMLELATDESAPLAALLPVGWARLGVLLHGPASLTVRGSGPPEAMALRAQAEASGLRVDATPVVDTVAGRMAGALTLHHPGARRLLGTFGLDNLAASVGEGSFSFLAQGTAGPGELRFDPFQLSAGRARMGGQIAVGLADEVAVTGRIAAESLPVPPTMAGYGDPLPTGYLPGWRANVRLDAAEVTADDRPVATAVGTNATLMNGQLTLANGTATLAGAPATFEARLDAAAEPPVFALRGAVAGAAVTGPLGPSATVTLGSGTLDASVELRAAGHSASTLLATLDGQVRAAVRDGVLYGIDLPGASAAAVARSGSTADVLGAVRAALTGGDGAFAQVQGTVTVAAGVATVADATVTDSAGTAQVSGTAYLPGGTLDLRIVRPAGGYAVALTGTFPDVTRTPELAGLARQLAEAPVPR